MKEHVLSKTKQAIYPEHVIFVDTETTQTKPTKNRIIHHFLLGVAIYYRNRKDGAKPTEDVFRFTKINEFWLWAFRKCKAGRKTYIISHNIVFDMTVLQHITHLSNSGYKCQFVFESGITFIGKWRAGKHTIVLLDNANWFQGKLAKWGNALNLPKMTMPVTTTVNEKMFTYCQRDTTILLELHKWYIKFLQEHNLGSWRMTIASSAFYSYRYRFMRHPITIPENEREQELARKSYHGGRTEVLRCGSYQNEPFFKIDINSMYPYVMKNELFPTRLKVLEVGCTLNNLRKYIKKYAVIAQVILDTPLPFFVYQKDGRNVYPIGEFETVLTSPEIELALEQSWIKEIQTIAYYYRRKLFTSYVSFFYGLKQGYTRSGQQLLKDFTKLYLNSLYGKFGQRQYVNSILENCPDDFPSLMFGINAQTRNRYIIRRVANTLLRTEKGGTGHNAFVSIASHVTAYARLYLYSLVILAQRENVFYMDTDSLIVNQRGYNNLTSLMDDYKIGYIHTEGKADSISVRAPKDYRFGSERKLKGVSKDAPEISPDVFEQTLWPGYNYTLKNDINHFVNRIIIKHINPQVLSGIIQNNSSVSPFVITL